MSVSPSEKIRVFLAGQLFTLLYGMTLGEWLRLLRKHRFAVDPPYWPRAAFMTGAGVVNSVLSRHETRVYGPKVAEVQIKPPIFILGHWRSGTTRLHNLLAVDQQFAYPNAYQALNPHTFLLTERYSKLVRCFFPETRIMDNVRFGTKVPFEDEFAICGTGHSPFFSWVFTRCTDHYDRYLTFRGVPGTEVAAWKAALLRFYQKLTWKYDRPLVLKSPPHTARVRLLLEMFPEARFVHMYRNPYTVFQSTKRQVEVMARTTRLQNPVWKHADDRIIQRYKTMYEAFFEDRALIADERFHEVRFEELEQDPVGQVKKIYEALNLPNFDAVQPALQHYVDATATYRKNTYPELSPSRRSDIAHMWQRSFAQWGYAS